MKPKASIRSIMKSLSMSTDDTYTDEDLDLYKIDYKLELMVVEVVHSYRKIEPIALDIINELLEKQVRINYFLAGDRFLLPN